jgi:hypothetical protein
MALQIEEQDELVELVEEQSDVIKEMAITQNALLSILINKGYINNDELETTREEINKQISGDE